MPKQFNWKLYLILITSVRVSVRLRSLQQILRLPAKKAEEVPTILKRHQILWNQVWSRKAHRGVEEMSIAVDARFTGYHDVAREDDGETLSLEAQEAAKCIQQSFEDWKSGT
mmetsp:Transcript_28852/g.60921  ORF Transcript_28852/g.60921 Transcript_28852/m.60921 type:complete len:112 (-) Transcript_28852:15-350(-)